MGFDLAAGALAAGAGAADDEALAVSGVVGASGAAHEGHGAGAGHVGAGGGDEQAAASATATSEERTPGTVFSA